MDQAALQDAITLCQRIADHYQREADEAGQRRERRTSPLLIRAGAMECVRALEDMAARNLKGVV